MFLVTYQVEKHRQVAHDKCIGVVLCLSSFRVDGKLVHISRLVSNQKFAFRTGEHQSSSSSRKDSKNTKPAFNSTVSQYVCESESKMLFKL